MISLLREDRLATEFRRMSSNSRSLSFAAPFWGLGAAVTLGLTAGEVVRVLCRFDAQACNPSALLEMAALGVSIRSHRRLHAKLYISENVVVVGSSNPSRFGLTQEGDVVGGTVEANIMTDDPDTVRSVRELFDDLWSDEDETFALTISMIRKEIRRRESDPPAPQARRLAARTLLAACREAPELFSSVFVCAYDSDLGNEGRRALLQLRREAPVEDVVLGVSSFRNAWGYQFERTPPDGSWIVGLDCKGNAPVVRGASKIPTPAYRLKAEGENDVTVTVRGIVTVPGARGEFKISAQDRTDLTSVAKTLLKGDGEVMTLPEVIALVDRRGKRRVAVETGERRRP